ncbi:antibiotic biosynthesis monooxygenase family protein [Thermoflavimicrobium daqui]|jgi:heme-degrading monooxygenase HmoA|uniref:Antibiotic biosynthesis monooxygenase n=1 Tax=Thermoflavimicrobium daqui TaxID=2137476 RepID=A0A364K539_9BACL|nr:antibiotic biosynthesis monooxygenase [Thermoflavimicrobium daqui]RAL24490.1 antibiotic biosynthesis monooxygenase [Thermoflavimicrobium daqui]
MGLFSQTPHPPYYAVIFSSIKPEDQTSYQQMSDMLLELLKDQPGYLGVESVRNQDGLGITISYWETLESIQKWKQHPLHLKAQQLGKDVWYSNYRVKICKVERDYGSNI